MQGSDGDDNKWTCIVWTTHKTRYVTYPIDDGTTIGYIKTLACSEWGIQHTTLYYLRQIVPIPKNNASTAWPDALHIPRLASGERFEFVLECLKDGHDQGIAWVDVFQAASFQNEDLQQRVNDATTRFLFGAPKGRVVDDNNLDNDNNAFTHNNNNNAMDTSVFTYDTTWSDNKTNMPAQKESAFQTAKELYVKMYTHLRESFPSVRLCPMNDVVIIAHAVKMSVTLDDPSINVYGKLVPTTIKHQHLILTSDLKGNTHMITFFI